MKAELLNIARLAALSAVFCVVFSFVLAAMEVLVKSAFSHLIGN